MARHFPKRSAIRINQAEVAWGVNPEYNGDWLPVAQTNNEIIRQSKKSAWESETGIGDLGNENNIRHAYSERPAINRTDEYMINNMSGGMGVLSHVGGNVARKCGDEPRYPRWMNTLDYEIYGPDRSTNKKLVRMHVLTDVVTVIADLSLVSGFGSYDELSLGKSQGQGDLLDDRFALSVRKGSDLVVVVWSAVSNSIVSQVTFPGAWGTTDNVELSRYGSYVIIGDDDSTSDYRVYNADTMAFMHTVGRNGHGVMCIDSDGVTECWASVTYSGPYRTARKFVLETGAASIIVGDGTSLFNNGYDSGGESIGGHLCFAPNRPGYVLWSNLDPEGPHTIAWVPLDGSQQIEWLCDHRSIYSGYYSESQASCNFNGTIGVFASNEGVINGEINSFCVRTIASKCPEIAALSFNVAKNSANGTVVGQLAAAYNSSAVTTNWRLHNDLNTAFAVNDNGQITVADSSKITTDGNQTLDIIVEGADGQTAEYVTITVGDAALVFDLDINGGQQSFPLGRTINNVGYHGDGVENTLLGGGWVAFSAAGSKTVDGVKVGTTREDKLAEMLAFANTVKTKPGVNGVLVYGRWKDYEDGPGEYSTALMTGLASVIAALKEGAKQFGFALDYKKFYATAASQCPVPSYVFGTNYGVSWSTEATQTVATAAVWRATVRDRVMSLINDMCSRYGNDIHLITIGETSISSVESDFSFSSWDTAFRYFIANIQALIPHGGYLAEINFYGNNGSDITNLIEYCKTVGAVCISLPDWLSGRASWTARTIPGNNYNINAYDLIRNSHKHKIRFFPHYQTWDAEQTDDWDDLTKSLELLGDVDGFGLIAQHSFVSRVQEYQTGSKYFDGNYLNEILWPTFAGAIDYFYSGEIEATQYNGGGDAGSGSSPLHAIGSHNTQILLLEPRVTANAGNSEAFTIEFLDAIGADESALIRYYSESDPNVGDGTPIDEPFYTLKPGVDNTSSTALNGTRWSPEYTGAANYSGEGAAIAEGSRLSPGTTGNMLFDISHIPAGSYPIRVRCLGANPSADSFFVRVKSGGTWSDWENVFIREENYGQFFWRVTDLVLTGQPELLEMGVREDSTVVDKFIFSASTASPSGKDGYSTIVTTPDKPVAKKDIYIVIEGTNTTLDVMRNDSDPAGGGLSLIDIYSPPQFGLASVVDGKILFEAPTYPAFDALQYRIIDSQGEIAIGEVTLIVGESAIIAPELVANDVHIMRLTTDPDSINIDLARAGFDLSGGDVSFSVDLSIHQNTGDVYIPDSGEAIWSSLGSVPLNDEMTYKLHSEVDSQVTAVGKIIVTTVAPQPNTPVVTPGSDIKLSWDGMGADASLGQYDLTSENGLRTAVTLSLFADRRASADDQVDDDDKRGWWADTFSDRPIGSRLWLLDREKDLPEVVHKAYDYAHEALAWLEADGIAKTVEVDVTTESSEQLEIHVRITRPNNELLSMKFQRRWQTEADR